MGAQDGVNFIIEPTGIAKFESGLAVFGQQADELSEARGIGGEVGRQLIENGAQSGGRAQRLQGFQEIAGEVFGVFQL